MTIKISGGTGITYPDGSVATSAPANFVQVEEPNPDLVTPYSTWDSLGDGLRKQRNAANTDWVVVGVLTLSKTQAVRVFLNVDQVISNGVPTKVLFNAVNLNEDLAYREDSYRPRVPGYYFVKGRASGVADTTTLQAVSIMLRKNGVEAAISVLQTNFISSSTVEVSTIVYMNGTSDYIDAYAQLNATSSGAVRLIGNSTRMYCCLEAILVGAG